MLKSNLDIPVLVLQYGKFDLTTQCIKDLREQTVPVKIWLIDGNSPGKDKQKLEELGKMADKNIFLKENLGYAGANNQAIKEVLKESFEYFLILNNDIRIESTFVESLLRCMQKNPRAAQVCPQVRYPNGELQAAGGTIKKGLFEPQLIGHLQNLHTYEKSVEVVYAPGMAILVRSAAVREAGYISDRYFMYGEDVDWSLRFSKHGWQVWYCPDAILTHFESASAGSLSSFKGLYLTRANVWLAKTWLGKKEWLFFKRAFVIKMLKQTVKFAAHPSYVKGIWQGYFAGMKERI